MGDRERIVLLGEAALFSLLRVALGPKSCIIGHSTFTGRRAASSVLLYL
jgi:hypothetical protein